MRSSFLEWCLCVCSGAGVSLCCSHQIHLHLALFFFSFSNFTFFHFSSFSLSLLVFSASSWHCLVLRENLELKTPNLSRFGLKNRLWETLVYFSLLSPKGVQRSGLSCWATDHEVCAIFFPVPTTTWEEEHTRCWRLLNERTSLQPWTIRLTFFPLHINHSLLFAPLDNSYCLSSAFLPHLPSLKSPSCLFLYLLSVSFSCFKPNLSPLSVFPTCPVRTGPIWEWLLFVLPRNDLIFTWCSKYFWDCKIIRIES